MCPEATNEGTTLCATSRLAAKNTTKSTTNQRFVSILPISLQVPMPMASGSKGGTPQHAGSGVGKRPGGTRENYHSAPTSVKNFDG